MVEKDEVRGHAFDGIEEYDNDLPRWWLAIFAITGIFSVIYIVWVHFGFRESDDVRLARQLEELAAMRPSVSDSSLASGAGVNLRDTLVTLASDSEAVGKGKELYGVKCAACHGQLGEGLIGPNLTDKYWIHGGSITDIHRVIVEGVPEKGMLAWGPQLTPDDINAIVSFIWMLRDSNPPNPKAAEGELADQDETASG